MKNTTPSPTTDAKGFRSTPPKAIPHNAVTKRKKPAPVPAAAPAPAANPN